MSKRVLREEVKICDPGGGGMFLPLMGETEQQWDKSMRSFLYLVGLLYMFMAVNVGSDYFMSAVERITAARKRVFDKERGRKVTKNVWNETVANLSLLALGSSAPEILLSFIEISSNRFYSGKLGPSTIVGSAAFNLFVILSVCISCIPDGEVRFVKASAVFHVTVVFCLFAYLWLWIIVVIISPDVIDVWEALVTLFFMFVLIAVSFLADLGYLPIMALERNPPGAIKNKKADGEVADMAPPELTGSHGLTRAVHPKVRTSASKLHYEPGARRGSRLSSSSAFSRTAIDPKDLEEEGGEQPAGATEDGMVCGKDKQAISCPAGIITFRADEASLDVKDGDFVYNVEVLRRNGTKGRVEVKWATYSLTAIADFDYEQASGTIVFEHGENRKWIVLQILGKQYYEKDDAFQLVLEEIPRGGAKFNPNDDGDDDEAILTVNLVNDCQYDDEVNPFEAFLAKCFDLQNLRAAWKGYRQQWHNAFLVGEEDEDGQEKPAKAADYVFHILLFPWKVMFAIGSPPPNLGGGWVLFFIALFWIGSLTAIVGDLASLLGCCAGMDDAITAITTVALGTSLPDAFASMTAAQQDEHADASIVNVTGSNSVNVFLGIGMPWTIASVYWSMVKSPETVVEWRIRYPEMAEIHADGAFVVYGGNLGFSVMVFCNMAVVCLCFLRVRRRRFGGELGGHRLTKHLSSLLLFSLWVVYITFSCWQIRSDAALVVKWPLFGISFLCCVGVVLNDIWVTLNKGCVTQYETLKKDTPPGISPAHIIPAQKLGIDMMPATSEQNPAPLVISVESVKVATATARISSSPSTKKRKDEAPMNTTSTKVPDILSSTDMMEASTTLPTAAAALPTTKSTKSTKDKDRSKDKDTDKEKDAKGSKSSKDLSGSHKASKKVTRKKTDRT